MESAKKKNGRSKLRVFLRIAAGIVTVVMAALLILPSFVRCRHHMSLLTGCKSNLKNIGTALEMYSTDYSGHYPRNLAMLTPNYLKTIPECPKSHQGSLGYFADFGPKAGYNEFEFVDYYFVECNGEGHLDVRVGPNYPQYDGISGLIER